MKTLIHARDERSLRNGSYVSQRLGVRNSTFGHYMNGDFMGWLAHLPKDLLTWSLKDAKKIIGKAA